MPTLSEHSRSPRMWYSTQKIMWGGKKDSRYDLNECGKIVTTTQLPADKRDTLRTAQNQ